MDLNRQEVHANMQGGPVPQQVMHGPRPSHGNGTHFQKCDYTPRMSGAMSGPEFHPQQYGKVNPSYPPGFGMVAPGFGPAVFDYTRSVHGGMNYQESLEITSHTPFIPQRRGDSMSFDRRAHGPTQSFPSNVRGRDPHAQEASEGSPSELQKKKKRKRTKGSKVAQPAQADTVGVESPIEQVRPTTIQGEPCVPRSDGPAVQRSATHDFDEGAIVCQKLWQDLSSAFKNRERVLREKEQSFTQSTINKDALEEEKKQVAVMQNEILEERRKLQEEAQRIRETNDALESRSTEIALQMVELKQLQKQVGKEKAALLALKAGGNLQEQEGVEVEVEEPENRGNGCTHESEARQSNTNFKSVKVEPGAPESDAAHRDTSKIDDYPSDDGMDDLPLAQRLKAQRAEKRKEKKRGGPNAMQQEHSYMESGRRKSSMPYDHLKRNKVPIEVALQEDAPGLLEQLEEKGLLRDDISVYQDLGSDDSLANESPATDFGELEGVIGKLWGNSSGGLAKDLIALKVQANGSGSVSRYCLACLLSLIDQTKSLRKRNWPVNWGWCRRLRAFLFVFEKHNRIVLERPEYGYATYFFELVQRLPVEWQVQRLIVVMSVASTGRAALLGNHQLLVGTHLSDEEAAILEDYGWNRSSGLGLGSLLNFCERVVHDYNKGQDPAELGNDWKQKIGKLLMDGYDQGSILTSSIPRKLEKVLGNTSTDTTGPCSVKAEPHM